MIEGNYGEWADVGQLILRPGIISPTRTAVSGSELPAFCREPDLSAGKALLCSLLSAGTTAGQLTLQLDAQRRREALQTRSQRISDLDDDLGQSMTELRGIINAGTWSVREQAKSCNVLGAALYDTDGCSPEQILRYIWPKHLWELARVRLASAARNIPSGARARTAEGTERGLWFRAVTNWLSVAHGSTAMPVRFLQAPPRAVNMINALIAEATRRGRRLWLPFDHRRIFGLNLGYHGRNEGIFFGIPATGIKFQTRKQETSGCGGFLQPPCPAAGRAPVIIDLDRVGSIDKADAMTFIMDDESSGNLIGLETKTRTSGANEFVIPTWGWMLNYLLEWTKRVRDNEFDRFVQLKWLDYIQYLKQFPEDMLGLSPDQLNNMEGAMRGELRRGAGLFATGAALLAGTGVGVAGAIILALMSGMVAVVAEVLPLAAGGKCPWYPVPFLLRSPIEQECRSDTRNQSALDALRAITTMASRVGVTLVNPWDEGGIPPGAERRGSNLPILIGGAIGAIALAFAIARQ